MLHRALLPLLVAALLLSLIIAVHHLHTALVGSPHGQNGSGDAGGVGATAWTKAGGGSVSNALQELHHALQTMQDTYFELWLGTWPNCIDWTAAVMGTYVSASLYSLTRSLDYSLSARLHSSIRAQAAEAQRVENEINKYFSQSVSYYFGEDAFALRQQAYDDMLWVVLGWLENLRFVALHSGAHYPPEGEHAWYGQQFSAAFAHRARIFYDLAKRGWDDGDCGGGMIWNPRLNPYKNAITNELFISASVAMYLHFPGDDNGSPFVGVQDEREHLLLQQGQEEQYEPFDIAHAHDPAYLHAAETAYRWLSTSGMRNAAGLYIDGFHITRIPFFGGGVCDQPNDMVYTYNQGVILSGLRGLWEATGKREYLRDGHELVRSVIRATGWDLTAQRVGLTDERNNDEAPASPSSTSTPDDVWHGLGRAGILEEACDASGTCSQDGQTFKGIFFHHLTLFCESLPRTPLVPNVTHSADPETFALHRASCSEYAPWVARNAVAALGTRDGEGRFGGWWGARAQSGAAEKEEDRGEGADGEDYRNRGLGAASRWGEGWRSPATTPPPRRGEGTVSSAAAADLAFDAPLLVEAQKPLVSARDANDRGRGRTVETQGAGVAVVRAMWEFIVEHGDTR